MEIALISIFVIGYCAIAFEHIVKINKSASALITGVLCWTVYIVTSHDKAAVASQLDYHMGSLSGILFFLLCAMTIVELIDAHDGFEFVVKYIKETDKRKLIWVISFLAFFMSAILDNLTTTIVIISFLRKLVSNYKDRLFFAGVVVIAANAGGAWSPIGDVTTTMLWISNNITSMRIITSVLLPSIVSLLVPLICITFFVKGKIENNVSEETAPPKKLTLSQKHQRIVFFSGICILFLIPVFKTLTHLPPYMGALIGLGLIWVITEFIHDDKDEKIKKKLSIGRALRKIDTQSILFFLGILISVAGLESSGILSSLASWLTKTVHSENIIVISIGILSSIVDNVPLVAAVQGMYSLTDYPTNHSFWLFLAYCAGNGGSILIIGSAAGVAAMGLEKINFFWYLKRISLLALLGYFSGALTFILQQYLYQ